MIINPMATNATWFSSSQIGAPSVNTTDPSGLLKILDACLVTGWGEKSILSASIDGDLVTFNFGSGHGFNVFQKITITGADDPLLNGTHKTVSTTNNTATVRVIGALSSSGAIKIKIAPLGYESIFGTTDPLRRAYRSLSPSSNKRVLYLDMGYPASAGYAATTPSRRAMVSVCEDMTVLGEQINSLTDVINNKPTNKNGALFWHQSRNSTKDSDISSQALNWKVIGNGDFFYIAITSSLYFGTASFRHDIFGFGEYVALDQSQPDRVFISANYSANDNSTSAYSTQLVGKFGTGSASAYTFALDEAGLAKNIISPFNSGDAIYMTSGLAGAPYPSAYGNFLFTSVLKVLGSDGGVKGFMPSYVTIDHHMAGQFDGIVVDGVLIVRVPSDDSVGAKLANVGFYVGE